MITRSSPTKSFFFGTTVAVSATLVGTVAWAQNYPVRHAPRRPTTVSEPVYRGLTITRPPEAGADVYAPDGPYVDGPIRYNDIRDFSPLPSVDSGRQYPYGLDGIGGYGSDLGFNQGNDAALYDRGAFNRDARSP